MAGLVVRGDLLFFFRDHTTLALGTENYLLNRIEKLFLAHRFLILSGRRDRRLINEVREIRAGKPRCTHRNAAQVDAFVELLVARVDRKNRLAVIYVRQIQKDTPVKPSGTEQRGIKNVGTVGG